MGVFEAKIKKWGNSFGIIIPKECIQMENMKSDQKVEVLLKTKSSPKDLRKRFRALHWKKPTQQIIDEVDAEAFEDG